MAIAIMIRIRFLFPALEKSESRMCLYSSPLPSEAHGGSEQPQKGQGDLALHFHWRDIWREY